MNNVSFQHNNVAFGQLSKFKKVVAGLASGALMMGGGNAVAPIVGHAVQSNVVMSKATAEASKAYATNISPAVQKQVSKLIAEASQLSPVKDAMAADHWLIKFPADDLKNATSKCYTYLNANAPSVNADTNMIVEHTGVSNIYRCGYKD